MLEHLAKDRKKHGDECNQHQEQNERDAAGRNDRLDTCGTVVVAVHADRGNGSKDSRQNPRNNVGDQARQKLGKNRSTEQLGLVVLKGTPDLIERKRALNAAGHGKVHHGDVGEHLKENAQDRRRNQSKDEQAQRAKQRGLECIGAVVGIRACSTKYHALDQREHDAQHGNSRDDLEYHRDDARKDAQTKRSGAHQRAVHAVLDLEGQVTTPLNTKARSAHARNVSRQKTDRCSDTANDGDKQHEYRNDADQRGQKGNLAHTLQYTRHFCHILKRLGYAPLGRIRHGRLRGKRLRLSLRSGASGDIGSTARAAELIVVAHGGATLRTEHRNHPFVS